jgi:2-C-methyl-D-erythritol 4-phosphate cytidylyltransferase/2-C-methyl-D-erythritol 2,4-cyclodiphosphate synthase
VLPVLPRGMARPDDAAHAKLLPAAVGGERRQDSVAAGLAALPTRVEWVAVHDAARALVRTEAVTRVIDAAIARRRRAARGARARHDQARARGRRRRDAAARRVLRRADAAGVSASRCCARRSTRRAPRAAPAPTARSSSRRSACASRSCVGDADNWKITGPEDLAAAERVLGGRS